MDRFYVVLPSNVDIEDNKAWDYTVRLPNTLDLSDGNWTVALSSIIYPVSFYSETDQALSIRIVDNNNKSSTIPIPSDPITDIKQFQDRVNETILGENIRTKRQVELVDLTQESESSDEDREKRQAFIPGIEEEVKKRVLTDIDRKQLNAAKNEVFINSRKASRKLEEEIEVLIIASENLATNIINECQDIIESTEKRKELQPIEINDIRLKVDILKDQAQTFRKHAQSQRMNIVKYEKEYQVVLDEITFPLELNRVDAARKIADRAKKIVKDLNGVLGFVDRENKVMKNTQANLDILKEDLVELLTPIDEGIQRNINRIIGMIRSTIPKEKLDKMPIYFYYDNNLGKFFLYVNKPLEIRELYFSTRLAYVMGFSIDMAKKLKGIRIRRGGGYAKSAPDISSGLHQMYIYAPGLIENTPVGDSQVPLLRIISIDKPRNSVAENLYTQLYFIKVVQKRISSIKVQIRNSAGDFLKFSWGSIVVTLVFQRSFY